MRAKRNPQPLAPAIQYRNLFGISPETLLPGSLSVSEVSMEDGLMQFVVFSLSRQALDSEAFSMPMMAAKDTILSSVYSTASYLG